MTDDVRSALAGMGLILLCGCAAGPGRAAYQPPKLLFEASPLYPAAALAARQGGSVRLSVISEDPERCGLGAAAFGCVKGWPWTVGTPGIAFVVVSFRPEVDGERAAQQGV